MMRHAQDLARSPRVVRRTSRRARPGRQSTIWSASGHRRAGARGRPARASFAGVLEVLRGNPDLVAAVADSLDFEQKYTSVVIAWAPDDRPTDAQIGAVLDEFAKTAWAGLRATIRTLRPPRRTFRTARRTT